MKRPDKQICMMSIFLCLIFCLVSDVRGETYGNVPPAIQAALFLKIFGLNNDMNGGKDISVHVVSSPEFEKEMKKAVGKAVGKSKITVVEGSSELPSQKPSVIYVSDPEKADEVMKYTRSNKILSITGTPDLVAKGVSLGLGASGGKPKILLNMPASKYEGVNWNPAIFKISVIFRKEE